MPWMPSADYLEKQGIGTRAINYRLRDWGISRQRYWGAPIPIIYCDRCGIQTVPEKDLPVVLPLEVGPKENGASPLPDLPSFVETQCPDVWGAGASGDRYHGYLRGIVVVFRALLPPLITTRALSTGNGWHTGCPWINTSAG